MKQRRARPTLFTKANGVTFIRTVLFGLSMKYAYTDIFTFINIYTASMLLDMLDGYVSRYFNESTLVGAIYDQLLDRMTSSYLCFLNAKQYPEFLEVFYLVLAMDICGHWCHNYACALHSNTNHKEVHDANIVLKVYYENKPLMFASIVMYETFFCSLYARSMLHAGEPLYEVATLLMYITSPLCAYKMLTNVLQGAYGVSRLLSYDRKLDE